MSAGFHGEGSLVAVEVGADGFQPAFPLIYIADDDGVVQAAAHGHGHLVACLLRECGEGSMDRLVGHEFFGARVVDEEILYV